MLPSPHWVLTSLSCLALLSPLSGQAAPPTGRLLASQCAQCHGTEGQSVGDIDSLRGESAGELYNEMMEMKYGNKPSDIMHSQAKGYTDTQIRLIADYYAGLSSGATGNEGSGEHRTGDGERTKDEQRIKEDQKDRKDKKDKSKKNDD